MRSLKLKLVGSTIRIRAPVDESYKGQQYWYMYGARTTDRMNSGMLNERENFFHKPLVNLNHFYDVNDQVRLSSILYWSGGSGGGTGTYGSVSRMPAVAVDSQGEDNRWWASSPWMWDWNAEIAENSANVDSAWSETETVPQVYFVIQSIDRTPMV